MIRKFNVGIMGAGNIAGVMANTVNKMKNAKLYGVASREQVKADVFAGKYGCKKAYGSYEELAMDKKVDLIYVASPHSEHYANAKLCMEHGKPVFLGEAIWTRYMPMLSTIREVIDSKVIGEAKTLTANLGYVIDGVPRLQDPALAGGALLDVGVYTINFALMVFGKEIEKISSNCTYTKSGVDEQNSITIQYKDGRWRT